MTTAAYGRTRISVCEDYESLGATAAAAVAERLRQLLAQQDEVRIVLAAGESQGSFNRSLGGQPDVDWPRVTCFNVDDFWDPRLPRQFTCGYQTEQELYRHIDAGAVHLVDFTAQDPQAEADRFEALVREAPIDVVCQGIGTSGHLALNEPGQARFHDERWVRVVDLVEQSKRQLRDDPNFRDLGYVPDRGVSMTIPAIMSARHIYTMVPLALKRPILTRLLATVPASEMLPASILQDVDGELYVDADSCPETVAP